MSVQMDSNSDGTLLTLDGKVIVEQSGAPDASGMYVWTVYVIETDEAGVSRWQPKFTGLRDSAMAQALSYL